MTEPDPVLADPAQGRLTRLDQVQDEWGPHLAEMMKDPEFRRAYEAEFSRVEERDRRWAESHRTIRIVVVAAFLLGVTILAVGVVWYVMVAR